MTDNCVWCKYTKCVGKGCDFKTLPYTEVAISERVSQEAKWVNDAKVRIGDSREFSPETGVLVAGVIDRVYAISLMVKVLSSEFGVSQEDARMLFPKVKLTFLQQTRLAKYLFEYKDYVGGSEDGII